MLECFSSVPSLVRIFCFFFQLSRKLSKEQRKAIVPSIYCIVIVFHSGFAWMMKKDEEKEEKKGKKELRKQKITVSSINLSQSFTTFILFCIEVLETGSS